MLLQACPTMPATVIAERIEWRYSIRTLSTRVAELRRGQVRRAGQPAPTSPARSTPASARRSRRTHPGRFLPNTRADSAASPTMTAESRLPDSMGGANAMTLFVGQEVVGGQSQVAPRFG